MKFTITHRTPSIAEYNTLRELAGWPTFEFYKDFGFMERPSKKFSAGMIKFKE